MKCSKCNGYLKNGICSTCGIKKNSNSSPPISREFHLMPHELMQFSSSNEVYHNILQKNAEYYTKMIRKYGKIMYKHLELCKVYFEAMDAKDNDEFVKYCIELIPDIYLK
jgi:hypothetical protein